MTSLTIDADEVERWVELGVWQRHPLHVIVERHAQSTPDRLAVADQSRRLSYAELMAEVTAVAAWLVELELPPGAVVALQAPSSTIVPTVHLACDKANLTFLPISSGFRNREVEHLLRLSDAQVMIVPAPGRDYDYEAAALSLQADLPELRLVASMSSATDVDVREVLRSEPKPVSWPATSPDEPRMTMITSGSTALPKISLYTDNNMYYFCEAYADTVELTSTDVCAGFAPANTGSTGYVFPVLAPLLRGATSIMLEHWNPVAAVELLQAEHPTIAVAVPTQIIRILQVLGDRGSLHTGLRAFTNAGAPMPPEVAKNAEKVLGCQMQPLYGATDGGVPVMTRLSDPPEKRHTTAGRPLPHTVLRLVDDGGNDVPAGATGEVLWRNPIKSLGYMNDNERTELAFTEDGLYRSGDLGRVDPDGYLRIVGRVKDLIIRGGQNISPREVEDLLITLDAVSDVAVIGIPDATYGEVVCACVIAVRGCALELPDITGHLRAADLAEFKLPARLEVFEDFPRNTGAKVSKPDLRTAVLERIAARAESPQPITGVTG